MRFMTRFVLILCTLFMARLQAQHHEQPQKESSADLRSHFVLFSIEIPDDKKTYKLERTASQDYFVRMKKKNDESIRKISSKEAQNLDKDFASRFLKCQYELESQPGKCEVTLRLTMKGERQEICEKDEKKTQEMMWFLNELAKRF
jgi:hypothetical protein